MLTWNVGLVDTTEALSGFSNEGMLAVGALFVVIKGVEKSQLADKAARRVFGLRTSLSAGLGRMMCLCFVLSAFLNNTPVVALLIPITRDWARARGFSPSIFLIPLSYSCIMGGLLTVIGTSTNLVVLGLVTEERQTDPTVEKIGFFEPAYVGVPLGIVGMIYLVIFAPRVLPSRGGLFRYVRDRAKELLTEVIRQESCARLCSTHARTPAEQVNAKFPHRSSACVFFVLCSIDTTRNCSSRHRDESHECLASHHTYIQHT